ADAPTQPQSQSSWTPSYDCNNVESGPERMICANPVLSKLDIQLNNTYAAASKRVSDRDALKSEQADWLKNVRNACSDSDCMSNAYRTRISELEAK
ncbi:MAG TPA: lysozyme inhibitor LprI family protein, partial [Rhodocyclaceae bacterium]|nr:lysozyme inhibitor LprI family protein [Rhodocyclaceae bacterium]